MTERRYGKHEGKVEENIDPLNLGRLLVSCPKVFGRGRNNWAKPCLPYAGPGVGFLVLPPKGARVWIEFEEGNTQEPIWTGCFWGPGEAAGLALLPSNVTFKTPSFEITSLAPPGLPAAAVVTIKHVSGASVTLDATSVAVTNGSGKAEIKLIGPAVKVNRDGLEVT
jgi:hypothetical protein